MCGICGLWNLSGAPVDPALLVAMRDSMSHRGPDGALCALLDVRGCAEPIVFENLGMLDPRFPEEFSFLRQLITLVLKIFTNLGS